MRGAPGGRRPRRAPGWDLTLVLLTTATLMGFGILCLFGMFYYKTHAPRPGWSVGDYQAMMNRLAAPLTIALIVWLVLCIPKRLFSRRTLAAWSAGLILVAAAAALLSGFHLALSLSLAVSAALQAVILILVIGGARLHFSGRSLAVRLGSSCIHLGFVLFVLDLAALQGSPWHLALFWVSTLLLTGGSVITFYFPRGRSAAPKRMEP